MGIIVFVFLFALAGCTQKQNLTPKSASSTPEVQEVKEESGAQVAPPAAIVETMQAQVKGVPPQLLVKPVGVANQIIAENRWGFSIYDPQTGREEFYTSSGNLLGSKKRQ